jgi:hypothetical protein
MALEQRQEATKGKSPCVRRLDCTCCGRVAIVSRSKEVER